MRIADINITSLYADALGSTAADNQKPQATAPDLSSVLQELQDNVATLNNQIQKLDTQTKVLDLKSAFKRSLKLGDSGEDVTMLQQLFIDYPDLYPADSDIFSQTTGVYDETTKAIIESFQTQAELKATGIFDTTTKEKLCDTVGILYGKENADALGQIDISSVDELDALKKPVDVTPIDDLQNQIKELSDNFTETQSRITNLETEVNALQSYASRMQTPTTAPAPTKTTTTTTTTTH